MLNTYVSFNAPTGSILNDMKNKKITQPATIARKSKSRSRMEEQKKALSSIFSLLGFTFLFTSIGANANVIDNTAFPPLPSSVYYAADYASDRVAYGKSHHAYPDRPQSYCLPGHSGYVNGVLINNIAYFSRNGRPDNGGIDLNFSNCTRTNPCGPSDFSQTGINRLNNLLGNTVMWFNGGRYGGNDFGVNIELNPGQSLHSRSVDYRLPARGDDRSYFDNTLTLNGNNTLEYIVAVAYSGGPPVTTRGAPNSIIGSYIGDPNRRVPIGIEARSQIFINDCDIFARGTGFHRSNQASNRSIIQNSRIDVLSESDSSGSIYGIRGVIVSSPDIENTRINVRSIGHHPRGDAMGIFSPGGSFSLNHSQVQVTSEGDDERIVYGIYTDTTIESQANDSQVHVASAHYSATALLSDTGFTYPSILIANNCILSANGPDSHIARSYSPTRVVINNSTCFINNQGVSCPMSTSLYRH